MLALLAPVFLAAVCVGHPAELDRELGQRSLPWLPPDLARQIVRHERDFARGAAQAAAWPAHHHAPADGDGGVERAIRLQCERLVGSIRARAPFSEVVAGLGVLAHFSLDLAHPFAASSLRPTHGAAFASYLRSAAPRIPIVFYGQRIEGFGRDAATLEPLLRRRLADAARLAPLVRDDLNRVGGPAGWPALDDRSTSFGAASVTLNRASTDFANLASWVWREAGGLVPPLPDGRDGILVWSGPPAPRALSTPPPPGRSSREPESAPSSPRLGFR